MCGAAINALKDGVFNGGKHLFLYLYKDTTSYYSFSILIDGTPYFMGIMWTVDDMDSLFVGESILV